MIEQIKQLVKDEKFCVLATISNSNPYCSLMAYISEEDCKKIYMATLRNTVKYRNLIENPMVSLLIDTRTKAFEDHINEMKALTIIGQFAEVSKRSRRMEVHDMLLQRHPYLDVFLDHPESSLFSVEIHSFLLLNGFTDSYYEIVSSSEDLGH